MLVMVGYPLQRDGQPVTGVAIMISSVPFPPVDTFFYLERKGRLPIFVILSKKVFP